MNFYLPLPTQADPAFYYKEGQWHLESLNLSISNSPDFQQENYLYYLVERGGDSSERLFLSLSTGKWGVDMMAEHNLVEILVKEATFSEALEALLKLTKTLSNRLHSTGGRDITGNDGNNANQTTQQTGESYE